MKIPFEIGDTVLIEPYVESQKYNYRFYYTDGMKGLSGKLATIVGRKQVDIMRNEYDDDGFQYEINLDERRYRWSSNMLSRSPSQFNVGDRIMILPRKGNGGKYRSYYADNMTKYANMIATITYATISARSPATLQDDGYIYTIDLDDGAYLWNSSMLTLVDTVDTNTKTTIVEDTVNLNNQEEYVVKLKYKKPYKFNFKL